MDAAVFPHSGKLRKLFIIDPARKHCEWVPHPFRCFLKKKFRRKNAERVGDRGEFVSGRIANSASSANPANSAAPAPDLDASLVSCVGSEGNRMNESR
jgi:hypothetical protein